jgi:hypothetical protein
MKNVKAIASPNGIQLSRGIEQVYKNPLDNIHKVEAIVVGAGPSFKYLIGKGTFGLPKLYGAGVTSNFLSLDCYAYGDYDHTKNLPTYPCRIVASCPELVLEAKLKRELTIEDGATYFEQVTHGHSSGGMALSLACEHHTTIGIIGFDGWIWNGEPVAADWPAQHKAHLVRWIAKGKKLVSLMACSIFNDLLLQEI